jgi:hypothetical protein
VDTIPFKDLLLPGGFLISEIKISNEGLADAMGREALAMTRVIGRAFYITVQAGMSDSEFSISVYHEVLETATVACFAAPVSVMDFNEGDFEREARAAFERWGPVSPSNLNLLLQFFGFGGK